MHFVHMIISRAFYCLVDESYVKLSSVGPLRGGTSHRHLLSCSAIFSLVRLFISALRDISYYFPFLCFFLYLLLFSVSIFLLSSRASLRILGTQLYCVNYSFFSCIADSASVPNPQTEAGAMHASAVSSTLCPHKTFHPPPCSRSYVHHCYFRYPHTLCHIKNKLSPLV